MLLRAGALQYWSRQPRSSAVTAWRRAEPGLQRVSEQRAPRPAAEGLLDGRGCCGGVAVMLGLTN
jgi:hypothetical protein